MKYKSYTLDVLSVMRNGRKPPKVSHLPHTSDGDDFDGRSHYQLHNFTNTPFNSVLEKLTIT